MRLPRIFQIVTEINRRFCADLWNLYPGDWDRISRMSIVAYNQVRMANLCLATCHAVNGVSKLHTQILTDDIFADYYRLKPERFHAVTNGITFRRWFMECNPELSSYVTSLIGDGWKKDASELEKNVHAKFEQKIASVNQMLRNQLADPNAKPYKDLSLELKNYMSYIFLKLC